MLNGGVINIKPVNHIDSHSSAKSINTNNNLKNSSNLKTSKGGGELWKQNSSTSPNPTREINDSMSKNNNSNIDKDEGESEKDGKQVSNLPSLFFYDLNPFHATDLFWYFLKTSENQRFSDVFRGYQRRSVTWNAWSEGARYAKYDILELT